MQYEDCDLLVLNDRLENLIITILMVPPHVLRPFIRVEGQNDGVAHDTTERLKRIIIANDRLQQDLSQNIEKQYPPSWRNLQYEVAHYINSDASGVPQNYLSTNSLEGFVQRFKGNQGRFRGNLWGKRVDYTGRTLISPDPNLKISEVAIPILMSSRLTYPERVSHHNIEKLRQYVRNGLYKYPGARYLTLLDGSEIFLEKPSIRKQHADQLKCGCIVQRFIEDGDIVLLNRQPSLHQMSIMCHQARIMPWRTLRFNPSVCNAYNANFDGDEMTLHVPQTEEARTEALVLMGVQSNLCTPKNGEILVASTQDFLTSSYLITRKDTFYDRSSFSLMCSYLGDAMEPIDLPTPALMKPVELWTGKQLFSVLLCPHAKMRVFVNLSVAEKNCAKSKETMCPKDGFVYIRNSELISGQLGKATLGNGNKDGLYSVLLRDYGAHAAATCMNRLAKLSSRWIGNHGFSIGISDVQPLDALDKEKKVIIDKEYGHCTDYIHSYTSGTLKLLPGCNKDESLEEKITGTLKNISETTASVCMKHLNWRNSPLIMSECGSEGSPRTICQMIACVGQQSVGGRRAPNGFVDRTLPHFKRKEKDPDAKGFVQNSFYSGLSATEFFFHTMTGREDLVDKAVKTFNTGYIRRRLIKALEDLSVNYDYTVRDSSARIIQFMYGGDGMDPAQMEEKSGLPLNFERLLMKAKATCPVIEQKTLSIEEIKQTVDEIIEKKLIKSTMTPEEGCLEAYANSLRNFIEKKYPSPLLKLELDEGQFSNISGITRQQLVVFLETCISRYHSKKIEAGTAIGAIGAQSIGEATMQMRLKTFYFSGVASMNVTIGVPRVTEIINAAEVIKTPIITTVLQCDNDDQIAQNVRQCIEQVAKTINLARPIIINEAKSNDPGQNRRLKLMVKGTGLLSVMSIEGVDGCRTTSNNILEVQKALGVEAARKTLVEELQYVMSVNGLTIDTRHIELLADVMTYTGEVLGITGDGIEKMKPSVLMSASFKKTAAHLFDAAATGRVDRIEGATECIAIGKPIPIGTGMLKVMPRSQVKFSSKALLMD